MAKITEEDFIKEVCKEYDELRSGSRFSQDFRGNPFHGKTQMYTLAESMSRVFVRHLNRKTNKPGREAKEDESGK